jgi:hypothetical protein
MSNFSAFVDLVGVRELAKSHADRIVLMLQEFQKNVGDAVDELDGSDRVYFLSDSIFVETGCNSRLIKFLQRLRCLLFVEGIYFKGAIAKGTLEHVEADCWPGIEGDLVRQRRKIIQGSYFGSQAARLYSLQEQLKGVGFWVESSSCAKNDMVVSSFLPDYALPAARSFCDLAYTPEMMRAGIVAKIVEAIEELKSKSSPQPDSARRLVRYYIPVFVSMARGLSLDKVTSGVLHDLEQLYVEHPLVYMLWSNELQNVFRGVRGYEQIHFAFMSQLISQQQQMDQEAFDALMDRLVIQESMFNFTSNVPTEVFSDSDREFYREKRRIFRRRYKGRGRN